MSDVLQIGPLALSYDRLLTLGLLWAFLILAGIVAKRLEARASQTAWIALVAGLIAARLAYVARHWAAYQEDPLSIVAIWQGGFSLWAWALLALVVIIIRHRLKPAGLALAAGIVGLSAAHIVISSTVLASKPVPFPENLTVTTLDGTPVSLDSLRGQPFVVNLWATWCPPCQREMPMLVDVAATSDIPILLANQGESAEVVRAYLSRKGFSPEAVFLDQAFALQAVTGNEILPSTLFVTSEGMVTHTHIGELSRAALLHEMAKLR